MLVTLMTRSALDLNVLRDRNPLYVTLSDGAIRNGYTVKVINKLHEDRTYRLTVEGLDDVAISVIGAKPGEDALLDVKPDSLASFRVFLTSPRGSLADDATPITFLVTDTLDGTQVANDSVFRGPGK